MRWVFILSSKTAIHVTEIKPNADYEHYRAQFEADLKKQREIERAFQRDVDAEARALGAKLVKP